MTAAAMLIYPDFFKVGSSESGNHENNIYNNTWSEKHHGVKEFVDKGGKLTFEYGIETNSEIATTLKSHLMLVTGIDNNVHAINTYRLADALTNVNKRFDFMLLPGMRHSYMPPIAEYVAWRRADYIAQHLLVESDQTVDMWQLNRERQDKPATVAPNARGTAVTQQGRGSRRGGH